MCVDFIAVNAYTMGMFAPLSFLGTIYNSVIQSLVDVKHLLNLLTEEPDVLDVENAADIPIYSPSAAKNTRAGGGGSSSEGAFSTFPCTQCGKTVQDCWLCCPFCRADVSRPTAGGFANLPKLSISLGASKNASAQQQQVASRGVSVEFESKSVQ
jgi:hypothetical protein